MLTRSRKMAELNSLKEMLKELAAGQASMKDELAAGQAAMKEDLVAGQVALKEELKKDLAAGQEEMKAQIVLVNEALQEKLSTVESRMDAVEVKVQEMTVVEEKVREIEENLGKINEIKEDFSKMKDKFETIEEEMEKKVLARFENKIEESFGKKLAEKIEQMDPQNYVKGIKQELISEATSNRSTIKLSTYDGKTSWKIYKSQFSIVAEANKWDEQMKAFQLAASLRGDAASILETLPENQKLNFNALISALELRFGEECLKEYSRLQLKSRCQKAGETIQEYAADIERLSLTAFPGCQTSARDILALDFFIAGLRDPEIKKSLMMSNIKDMKSAIVHALKYEAVQKTSGSRHSIRAATVHDKDSELKEIKKDIKELSRMMQNMHRNTQYKQMKCWICGKEGHGKRNCPARKEDGSNLPPQQGNF